MQGLAQEGRKASQIPNDLTFVPAMSDFFATADPLRPYAFQAPSTPSYDDLLSVALLAKYTGKTVSQLLSSKTLVISDAQTTSETLVIGNSSTFTDNEHQSSFERIATFYNGEVLKRRISDRESRNAIIEIGKSLSLIRRGITFDLPSELRIGLSSEVFSFFDHTKVPSAQLYVHAGEMLKGALALSKDPKSLSDARAQALFERIMREALKPKSSDPASIAPTVLDFENYFAKLRKDKLLRLHEFCGPCLLGADFLRLRIAGWSDDILISFARSIVEAAAAIHQKRQELMKAVRHINTDFGVWYFTTALTSTDIQQVFHCGANVLIQQLQSFKMWKRPSATNKLLRSIDIRQIPRTISNAKIHPDSTASFVHFEIEKFGDRARQRVTIPDSIHNWCKSAGLSSDQP